jgi:hypothetical protein
MTGLRLSWRECPLAFGQNLSYPFASQDILRTCFAKHEGFFAKHSGPESKKTIRNNDADVAELVDARDLKSLDGNVVWVRVPPPAPEKFYK